MKPKKDESKPDFLKRCTADRVTGGEDKNSAYSACNLDWDNANKQRSKLDMSAPVEILSDQTAQDGDNKDQKRSFLITAYTGADIDRFWGKLVIALAGIKTKKKTPVLREHERDRVVGSGKLWTDENGLYASGDFSKATMDAKEVLELADEGYPWQASMYIKAKKVKVLESDKETEVVNGREIKGPADIWLESEVGEVSFVSLGADSETAAIAFSEMDEKTPVTITYNEQQTTQEPEEDIMQFNLETLAKEAPELLKDIRDEAFYLGAQAERDRVLDILKADGDKAVTQTAIETGTQASEAFKLFYEALKQKKKDGLENLEKEATQPAGQDQLEEEYDDPDKKDTRPADKKLASMAAKLAREEEISLAKAMEKVYRQNPDLVKEWNAEHKNVQ